ncbi:coiled-coil domain-containing protein 167 [Callorhinchus milii]|nr:coiled-coil domain-containing protein 167 [Callorhinchus milii]
MGKKQPRGTVTSAIDALEERLAVCKENLETIDWQLHREELSMESRQSLQDEKTMLKERVSRYEHELWSLRKENGRNMVLSLALLSLFLLLYLCWGL